MQAACLCVVTAACRDLEFDGGQRIDEQHVLSGRAAAEGGPRITPSEHARGWFLSRDQDLAPLQSALRTRIDGRLEVGDDDDITNELTVHADGTVKVSTPVRRSFESRSASLRLPFAIIDTNDYRRQYAALCRDDLFRTMFPARGPEGEECDPLALGRDLFLGLDADTLLDQMAFKLEQGDIAVRWVAPRDPLNLWRGPESGTLDPAQPPGDCCNGCSSGFACTATGFTCVSAGPDAGLTGGPACEWEGARPCETLDDCRVTSGDQAGWYAYCTAGACDFTGELVGFDRDPDAEAPVLEVRLPFDVHTDLIDIWATWLLGGVDVTHLDANVRLQPVACLGGCATADGLRALAYRGPSPAGDLRLSTTALDVHVRATHGAVVRFYPSVLCTLIPSCVLAGLAVVPEVNRGLNRAVRNSAEALELMVRIPSLVRGTGTIPPATFDSLCAAAVPDGAATCDRLAVMAGGDVWKILSDNISIDLALAQVQLNDASGVPTGPSVPLGAPGGVWTDTTTQALAVGGRITSVTVNSQALAAVCGGGSCGGPLPDPRCPVCALCGLLTPPGGMPPGLCRFGPTQTFTDANGLYTIPASPQVAQLLDASPNLAAELRGIFTRPLEDLAASLPPAPADVVVCDGGGPLPARYTDTRRCGGEPPPPWFCPPDQAGALFYFEMDVDGDAVYDPGDNCPHTCNPDQVDVERDGLGDACDTCPCTGSRDDHDRDRDGLQNPCDCDLDGDGCNNEYLVAPIAGCGIPASCGISPGAETYDSNEWGCERDEDDPAACADTDGDGVMNDCDADDDGDGVPDASDVCRLVADPAQLDENEDGIGDACDVLCPGAGTAARRPGGPAGGRGGDPRWLRPLGHVAALFPLRECWADGPRCPTFLALDCPTWQGRCASAEPTLVAFGAHGELLSRTRLKGVPLGLAGSGASLPDLDGDGLGEVLLGATAGEPCLVDGQCEERGAVAVVGSAGGSVLYSIPAPRAGEDFGASVAATGSLLFVGAPLALDVRGARTGAVYRIRLDASGPVFEQAFYGEGSGERFGETIVLAPEWEGGADALLVGAPGADVHGKRAAGRIDVLSLGGVQMLRLEGPLAGGQMGRQLTAVLPDAFRGPASRGQGIVAGMPGALGGRGALVFFTWRGERRWLVPGPGRDARLGASLSRAADLDGDGISEIAVGAPGLNGGAGAVLLVGPLGRTIGRLDGRPGDGLGERVVAPGDLDGDGLLELIASRPGAGLVTVFSGAGGQPPGDPIDAPF